MYIVTKKHYLSIQILIISNLSINVYIPVYIPNEQACGDGGE